MGSYDSAVMVGFICRLCCELNTNVIHIYSDKGKDMKLAEKINLMPITVEPQDSLPKTICRSCITQLNNQYNLIQQLRKTKEAFIAAQMLRNEATQEQSNTLTNTSNSNNSCDESRSE